MNNSTLKPVALVALSAIFPVFIFAQNNLQFKFCPERQWCNDAQQCHSNASLLAILESACDLDSLAIEVQIDLDQDGQNDVLASNILPYPYPNPEALPTLSIDVLSDGHGLFNTYLDALDFAVGEHQVDWRVTDACGSSNSCQQKIVVTDCEAPQILAEDYHFKFQNDRCELRLTIDSLDLGSKDNCGISRRLLISPSMGSGQLMPCFEESLPWLSFYFFDFGYDYNSSYDLWVQDLQGNWSYESHQILISIDDPFPIACIGEIVLAFEGSVQTVQQKPMPHLPIYYRGMHSWNNSYTDFYWTGTNSIGGFEFFEHPGNVGIYNERFELIPYKNDDPTNGVSTIDLILISRHLIGTQVLDSPYKILAADVDRNGALSAFDLLALQKVILQIDSTFSNSASWRFIPESMVFDEPTNPFTVPLTDTFHLEDFLNYWDAVNFTAIKVGDVNLDAHTCATDAATDRNTPLATLTTPDQHLQVGQSYTVALQLREAKELLGFQMALNYDTTALTLNEAQRLSMAGSSAPLQIQSQRQGRISCNWYQTSAKTFAPETALVELEFIAKTNGWLSDFLQINTEHLTAQIYDQDLATYSLALAFDQGDASVSQATDFSLAPIYPNPLQRTARLPLYLEAAAEVKLQVFDARGHLTYQQKYSFDKGQQQIVLRREDFSTNGLYYVQAQIGLHQITSKLMVID